jgi:hypothetical protein
LLTQRPTPKLEDHPLLSVRGCLFNIFPATLHSWRPFLHPQPENAPCCGDRGPPNIEINFRIPKFTMSIMCGPINQWFHVSLSDKTDLCHNINHCLYSGDFRFKFRWGYPLLPRASQWFSSFSPGEFRDYTSNTPRQVTARRREWLTGGR